MLICVLTHKMVYQCSSREYHRVTNVILKWSGDCLSNWQTRDRIFFWFSPGRSTGRQMLTVSRNCKETPLFQQNLKFNHLVLPQNSYIFHLWLTATLASIVWPPLVDNTCLSILEYRQTQYSSHRKHRLEFAHKLYYEYPFSLTIIFSRKERIDW